MSQMSDVCTGLLMLTVAAETGPCTVPAIMDGCKYGDWLPSTIPGVATALRWARTNRRAYDCW